MSLERPCIYRLFLFCAVAALSSACTSTAPAKNEKPIPQQEDRSSFRQFGKNDFDRFADVEMRENTLNLRLLMTKLYKRNPRELAKSGSSNVDERVRTTFENTNGWRFKEINELQGTDAIQQAFQPDYTGDRVLSFIVGLQTMLVKAHGGKSEFYLTDKLEPQNIYNAARNVEIAVWKLSNARDDKGNLYLLSNEIKDAGHNLSFERTFGKIIGSLDLYAISLSEKSQRGITRIFQSLASALFLPF